MELKNSTFYLVGSIPKFFRSANLRSYFSHFVEKKLFVCFHYRHRPELERPQEGALTVQQEAATTSSAPDEGVKDSSSTRCCVVALRDEPGKDFVKMYRNKNWSLADGSLLPGKVRISKLDVHFDPLEDGTPKPEAAIPFADLASLPELNPPSVMPQGNVGTPLSTFMTLIRTCKLPAHVIKKLKLEFPGSRSNKRYGAVEFKYQDESRVATHGEASVSGSDADDFKSGDRGSEDMGVAGNLEGLGDSSVQEGSGGDGQWRTVAEAEEDSNHSDDEIPPDDDHDAEEWERYEALHDDVDKQGRTKERLYEEDLEVVWEKGGSGLVFYTDASHWDQQEGDFDEKCSQEDDWDVDMSVYYNPGGGSKDANDMRDMEMERRLRAGEEGCEEPWKELGGFEKYTKGIGSKVLKKSGWTVGSGVGATNQGITEPVESDGQHPSVKRGLGYRGEKLDRNVPSSKKRRSMKDTLISTVYDKPEEEQSTVLRTAPPSVLKHSGTKQ